MRRKEKTMKLMIAALAAIALAGCAAPKYNYAPQTKEFSDPPVGSVSTAGVGEKMLSQGVLVRQEAIEVLAPFAPNIGHIIGPGLYLKTGSDDQAEYFSPKLGDGGGRLDRTATIFDAPSSVMLKQDGSLCVVTISTQYVCKSGANYERKFIDLITEKTLQQTLIYSGRIGNKINIGYREFSANLARMAFNNDVEYDLSESKIIGYKGAEIEILDATNRQIRYKLIKTFSQQNR